MPADDVDAWLALCAEYFARRAERIERCRRTLSDRSATGAVGPVAVTFLTAQFDRLDAAVRHGTGLAARVQRDRARSTRART